MKLSHYMAGVAILFVGLLICGSLDFDGIAQEMAVVDDGAPVCENGSCGPQMERSIVTGSTTTYSSSSSCGVSRTVRQRAGFFQRVRERPGFFQRVRNRGGLFGGAFRGRVTNYGCGG